MTLFHAYLQELCSCGKCPDSRGGFTEGREAGGGRALPARHRHQKTAEETTKIIAE